MSAKRKTLKTTSAPKCEVGPNGFRTGYMPNGDFVERVMDDGKESPLILHGMTRPFSKRTRNSETAYGGISTRTGFMPLRRERNRSRAKCSLPKRRRPPAGSNKSTVRRISY